ncbi:MAG: AraC family transcriptional regulator [Chitinophaga sp.]|uniref:AraC family transcriptional regulator n=1 Tax=Chitinophaga sp. TaxID=1869181 RepID=UPI001B2ABB3B|nr:helix-turn-helix domain-containing protein [Chitinophaga sp.]MBO9729825.1 AraC family transcriptional regulator [Chitinophaga sp.]
MEGYNSYRIPVPAAYEALFSHFYFAENKSGETVVKTLMPSYQTMMVFCFGNPASFLAKDKDEITIDKCMVLGPVRHAFNYSLPPNGEILVCNFKDDAFFRFFGDINLAQDIALHPDELLNENCFTALWSQLNKTTNNEHRLRIILDFCHPYLRDRHPIAAQLADFDRETFSPIKGVSKENKLSERAIQINHKKYFGYTAKELYRYHRFLKAIKIIQTLLSEKAQVDWFEIIDQCGYYDQSQLIRDFNHYLHLSPAKYLKFQEAICNPRD